jgi:hypothetical protein
VVASVSNMLVGCHYVLKKTAGTAVHHTTKAIHQGIRHIGHFAARHPGAIKATVLACTVAPMSGDLARSSPAAFPQLAQGPAALHGPAFAGGLAPLPGEFGPGTPELPGGTGTIPGGPTGGGTDTGHPGTPTAVPEAGTLPIVVLGLIGLGLVRRLQVDGDEKRSG